MQSTGEKKQEVNSLGPEERDRVPGCRCSLPKLNVSQAYLREPARDPPRGHHRSFHSCSHSGFLSSTKTRASPTSPIYSVWSVSLL